VTVIGVPVATCTQEQLVAEVERWIDDREPHFAVGINAHVVNLASADPKYAAVLSKSGLNYPDGKSIVWACRLLGNRVEKRLATTDIIYPLAENWAARGFRIFFFGGAPGVADAAADILSRRYPGFQVAGTAHGYLPPGGEQDLVRRINESTADVVLIGLGNPRQELWVAEHGQELTACAVLTCGGLFDWVSGRHRRPPQFIVEAGLEWLYRSMIEPRRLLKRYLIGNPRFCRRLLIQLYGQRFVSEPKA
jgi:N-acetylglucosaminyldiphosphoundecaprenol N-acetyl-beta-D-mannosaminyltransferase